jgi:NAD(P)-dependent dehydrogenase (short-subunit alcohol dehydrogenase family)
VGAKRGTSVAAANLKGKVAWVTGAGSGIGEAAALALAGAGASVVLTGRRKEPLELVAERVRRAGGDAHVRPGDMTSAEAVQNTAEFIDRELGRLDILVNNAGTNIPDRSFERLTPAGVDEVINGNLTCAFYCVVAVLPIMRRQKDGLIINTASNAGRFVSVQPGSPYVAAKHGVVTLSYSINMEECVNGIRATALCPGEVATPIIEKRPVPVSAKDRALMVQSEDVGDLILYISGLPPHLCVNEVMITPTRNRAYISALERGS